MDTLTIEILIYIAIGWFIFTHFAPVKGLKTLNSQIFKGELEDNKNKILIDVREPHEYQGGYIPGAINIPLSNLKKQINTIPQNKSILLYCQSGMRSKKAARILVKNNFNDLAHLKGGVVAWNGKIKKHSTQD